MSGLIRRINRVMESNSILNRYEDYLFAEMRLAKNSVATYMHECRVFFSYMSDQKVDLKKIGVK